MDTNYLEVNSTQISFTEWLYDGQKVTFIQDHVTESSSPIHEERIFDGVNTLFEISPYRIGDHSLSIYYKGRRLEVDTDYTEVNNTHVEILTPLTLDDKLIFRRETHFNGSVFYHDTNVAHETWIHKEMIAEDAVRQVSFDKPYIPNTGMLYVYLNGLLMDIGESDDYVEPDGLSIVFNYDLDVDDFVKIVCDPNISVWTETFVITNDTTTVLNLSNMYAVGTNDILVYYDGILLEPVEDFIETNSTTISFDEPIDIGTKIKVYRRR